MQYFSCLNLVECGLAFSWKRKTVMYLLLTVNFLWRLSFTLSNPIYSIYQLCRKRIVGFLPFPCEMQTVSSRIWTRIAAAISSQKYRFMFNVVGRGREETHIKFLFFAPAKSDDITTDSSFLVWRFQFFLSIREQFSRMNVGSRILGDKLLTYIHIQV